MKVILHIGTEKTGTTSIQKFIKMNCRALECQDIYTFPSILRDGNNFEFALASTEDPGNDLARFRGEPFESYREKFILDVIRRVSYLPRCSKLLLSSEHFSSRLYRLSDIEALRLIFPQTVEFEVIVYLRRQDQLYLGSVAEAMKAGVPFDKISRPESIKARERYGSAYYDYRNLLKNWIDVFGKTSLKVRIFDEACKCEGGLLEDFAQAVDFNSFGMEKAVESENKSLSPESLYSLNALCEKFEEIPRFKIISILQKIDPFDKGSFFGATALDDFLLGFADSNEWVSNNFFGGTSVFESNVGSVRLFDAHKVNFLDGDFQVVLKAFSDFLSSEGGGL